MSNPNPSPATRFKPGADWTGNPGGRPAGESFTSILRQALESAHKNEPTWRHRLVVKAIALAEQGDLDALKWIADRTDGRVAEKQIIAGDDEHPVRVEVTYHDETIPRESS